MLKRLSRWSASFFSGVERRVWFYRDYTGFTGGHLKHAHYYRNVQALDGYQARIVFSHEARSEREAEERAELWPQSEVGSDNWRASQGDLLFLAGLDWKFLLSEGGPALGLPKINLIQHVRHADARTDLYSFLTQKAVRICVSQEVADAIIATKRVNGPVIAIPNGVDVPQITAAALDSRCEAVYKNQKVLIVGYKMPSVAQGLADELGQLGIECRLVNTLLDRNLFLAALSEYSIVVCCPNFTEGFYLPAIEVMAAGAVLIVPDCVGNRGFCVHGETCFMPSYTIPEMLKSVLTALSLNTSQRNELLSGALEMVSRYSLDREREAFYSVLKNLDQLW
ncbi:hypothetical protein [Alkalimarinus coralli]|uniref:hypothetical protein n=1 Tax=Alkalimarinus coralli TaxID=2935863 RepID=UPI00202B5485|nr:hypothetical protein [Alkalimarinus coralli]